MFTFKEYPTPKQIRECIKQHNCYVDYVKVWFDDNTNKIYHNTDYSIEVRYKNSERYYEVCFQNFELSKPGSFGWLGIIRSKRVKYKKGKRKE